MPQFQPLHSSPTALWIAALLLATPGLAQNPLQVSGQVIATSGQAVPGVPGAVFGGAGYFDLPVVEANGNVFVRARFFGGTVGAADDRAWFYGTPGNVALIARGADQAPGFPAGVTLTNSSGAPGMTALFRVSDAGHVLAVTSLAGTGIASGNDSALLVGPATNLVPLVQEGDFAPGTASAIFASDFTTTTVVSAPTTGANAAGKYLFRSLLSGGDVVGTTNHEGWWLGSPGNLQLLVRRGDVMPDGHAVFSFAGTATTSNNFARLNAAGQVLWECIYSSSVGSPAPTGTNNQALYRSTLGGNHVRIAREGDPVPGLAGGEVFGATSGASSWGALGSNFSASGEVLFRADIRGGLTTTLDDTAILYSPPSGPLQLILRENSDAPGLSSVQFGGQSVASLMLNDNGRFVFHSELRGLVTGATDSSLWTGTTSGSLQIIAREGDPAPGTNGATLSVFSTSLLALNDLGTFVFVAGLLGGDVTGTTNDTALYQWTPTGGVSMIAREGDVIAQASAQPINGWAVNTNDNSGGSSLSLSATNRLAIRLLMGSDMGVIVYDIPIDGSLSFCTAGTTTNGCNATLSSSGTPSVSATSGFVISATNVEGQRAGLVFYGLDNSGFPPQAWGPSSSSFLCVKSPTQRTPSQLSGGTLGVCNGNFSLDWSAFVANNPSSLGAPFASGSTVYAQAWFRDPPAPKTTNLSDALQFTTQP